MPSLLDPIRLGALDARNRVFMAPLTRARASLSTSAAKRGRRTMPEVQFSIVLIEMPVIWARSLLPRRARSMNPRSVVVKSLLSSIDSLTAGVLDKASGTCDLLNDLLI